MPRKPCYWTRKLEFELVDFVRKREFIWKPIGNTNHHIQKKYKAYAEFASNLGCDFTARSVRDRWVNIRSTFNHNLRRVDKSKEMAQSSSDIFVPCWPLWKPLQFLREATKEDSVNYDDYPMQDYKDLASKIEVKEESKPEFDTELNIRQRGERTNRPRRKSIKKLGHTSNCKKVLDNLITTMTPLLNTSSQKSQYWFFGRHVTERLSAMRKIDAECASRGIVQLLTT
ncbi:uncharacterized protein LOC120625143 [Pararge aegeria]|uniref:Jg16914 protein n=2 Tax=Pararge aegeria TaxID=116150 RepID=A0A8S4SNU7_9NEOP|nr:uncharacterized protein LOC120625143 [Pararge aegeria]CAH2268485.1 jg16914 [Pararge aegeria aegeria]